jgi:hypothetical protein
MGTHFERTSLQALGHVVHFGHDGGEQCDTPEEVQNDFTVFATNGVHHVAVRFCGCHHATGGSRRIIQLLHASWFPATLSRPRTAFTFDVLDSFHLLTLQGKTSAYDYYLSLVHKSDNTGETDSMVREPCLGKFYELIAIQYRYDRFLFAIRVWRHLMLAKRAGRGHDPAGVDSTKSGDCAVECPACPHPDKNLPKGWETSPETVRYARIQLFMFSVLTELPQLAVQTYPYHRCKLSLEEQGQTTCQVRQSFG